MFEDLNDQIYEYEEKDKCVDIDSIIDQDNKTKKQIKNVSKQESKLSFTVSDKSLKIIYSNLSKFTIKFYLIDLEILFSRTPFIKQVNSILIFRVLMIFLLLSLIMSRKLKLKIHLKIKS
jgi:hypothetical protein